LIRKIPFPTLLIALSSVLFVAGLFPGGQWDSRAPQLLVVSGMLGIFVGIMQIVTAKYKKAIWIEIIISSIVILYLGFILFA